MEILEQFNSQDWLNIGVLIVAGFALLAILRIVINVAQSIIRMGCFLLFLAVGIYVLINIFPAFLS
ncbi:MAG: hypothetical protein AAF633_02590 [Chloroflexota bacterium]